MQAIFLLYLRVVVCFRDACGVVSLLRVFCNTCLPRTRKRACFFVFCVAVREGGRGGVVVPSFVDKRGRIFFATIGIYVWQVVSNLIANRCLFLNDIYAVLFLLRFGASSELHAGKSTGLFNIMIPLGNAGASGSKFEECAVSYLEGYSCRGQPKVKA